MPEKYRTFIPFVKPAPIEQETKKNKKQKEDVQKGKSEQWAKRFLLSSLTDYAIEISLITFFHNKLKIDVVILIFE